MTVYFYGRNSDIESYERGSSVITQKSKVQSYCNIKDLSIDVEVTEQISGTTPFEKRPKGFEIMQTLKRGDHIICSHLDRFSRNTLNLLTLVEKFKKMKVSLHFVDIGGDVTSSDAIGGVFLKMLSCFAEFYAKQISEKSQATKDRMIKENRYCGGKKKFGYDVDDNGYYVKCEKEQVTIKLMQMLRRKGKTYQEIADTVTKSTRKKFPQSWVYRILIREGVEYNYGEGYDNAINQMVELQNQTDNSLLP